MVKPMVTGDKLLPQPARSARDDLASRIVAAAVAASISRTSSESANESACGVNGG